MKRIFGYVLLAGMLGGMAAQHPAPAEYLALARAAQARYEWRRALAWYADAADAEPANAAPWLGMAQIRFGQGKFALAQQAIIQAEQRAPRDATIWRIAGDIAQAQHFDDDAAADWRRALTLAPASPAVADDLARLDFANGQPTAAMQDISRATVTSPALQADQVIAALHVGDITPAQTVLTSFSTDADFASYGALLSSWRGTSADDLALGYADLTHNWPVLAEQPLSSATQRRPHAPAGWLYLAWARWEQGDAPGAQSALQRVHSAGMADDLLVGLRALLQAQGGDAAGALRRLDGWLSHHAPSPAIWNIQAQLASQAGDVAREEDARWQLATTASLADRPPLLRALATFYLQTRLGRDDGRAAWTFAQLRLLAGNDATAADLLAQWDWQISDVADALAWTQRAIALAPALVAPHAHLAAWEAALGDTTAATLEAERVADLTER